MPISNGHADILPPPPAVELPVQLLVILLFEIYQIITTGFP